MSAQKRSSSGPVRILLQAQMNSQRRLRHVFPISIRSFNRCRRMTFTPSSWRISLRGWRPMWSLSTRRMSPVSLRKGRSCLWMIIWPVIRTRTQATGFPWCTKPVLSKGSCTPCPSRPTCAGFSGTKRCFPMPVWIPTPHRRLGRN